MIWWDLTIHVTVPRFTIFIYPNHLRWDVTTMTDLEVSGLSLCLMHGVMLWCWTSIDPCRGLHLVKKGYVIFVDVWNNKNRPCILCFVLWTYYCYFDYSTASALLTQWEQILRIGICNNKHFSCSNVYHQWSVTTKLPILAGLGRESSKIPEKAHCWRDIIYLPVSYQLQ